MKGKTKAMTERVSIPAPNFETVSMKIIGVAPLVICKFSEKAKNEIMDKQAQGSRGEKGTKREAKDFDALYEAAKHVAREGWCGIPAPAFRNAMISACRTVGFQMTRAKLGVFVEPDGFDNTEGTPLVKITKGKPHRHDAHVRLESGVADIRTRPMWDEWEATVRIRYDADMFAKEDIAHLMSRVGMQVGIGEGRPDSKKSTGQGWGLFRIAGEKE